MHKGFKHSAIFAFGVGTYAYICHKKHSSYTVFAAGNQTDDVRTLSNETGDPQGRSLLPSPNEPPRLKLQQVQIMFRHGARTPLHLIPKIPEANYDPRIILREHPASSFPFERLLHSTGEPADWSNYEVKMGQTPLKSGVSIGTLTACGKEQVYLLGRRLQSCYREKLNMATYNPQEVLVLSSNIKRTVESAQCVLAGFFSKEELIKFAKNHSPVKIYVRDRNYNILVPDTDNCAVLKKVNHAGIMHSDFIPGFKSDRLAVEKDINEAREKSIDAVIVIQGRIDKMCGTSGIDAYLKDPENQHTTEVDPVLQRLIEERGQAIERVERLWATAIARHPQLANNITESDMKALVYLRRLEVEKLTGKFRRGYRFHFHFDPNPFFSNSHLCKEVYIYNSPSAVPSWSEPIVWKKFGNIFEAKTAEGKEKCKCQDEGEAQKKSVQDNEKEIGSGKLKKPCTCVVSEMSFFQWYSSPTCAEYDHIWRTIKDDIWANPIKCLEGKSKIPDKWERSLNFVFARDDLVSRVTHGLPYPVELKKYEKMIDERATTMLLNAMTGQHETERSIVSRLSAGPLLTAMVEESEKVVNGKPHSYKMCLYSTHDSTLSGLLELLGIWDNKWPPFAADIRIELYQDTESLEHFVRVLYCGKVQTICGQKEDLLSWPDFMKIVGKHLIHESEYRTVCASDVLERFAKDLLKHVEGEVIKPSETPAGM